MARLLLVLLIILTVIALWRAFGPQRSLPAARPPQPRVKGPDDDEDFLWQLEKEAFKKRREENPDN